jgi:hypothetical protein
VTGHFLLFYAGDASLRRQRSVFSLFFKNKDCHQQRQRQQQQRRGRRMALGLWRELCFMMTITKE